MALLVGELYAKITSDSSQYRRDMDEVDRKGEKSARKAEENSAKVEAARKAEQEAARKAAVAEKLLAEERQKGDSTRTKLVAAEDRLTEAQRALTAAQERGAAVAAQVGEENDKASAKVQTAQKHELDAVGRLRVAEQALADLREKKNVSTSRMVAAEERLAAAHRNVAKAQAQTAALLKKDGEGLGDAIGDGVVKGLKAKASDDKLRSALKLTNVAGWVAQGGAIGAGLAGGIASGLVSVGATAIPIALAGAFLAGDAQLGSAIDQSLNRMMDGGRNAAQVLKGPLLHAVDDVTASWVRMEPVLGKMFEDAMPSVSHLTRGITGLAENALGGLAVATARSETTMAGFGTMLERTGTGLGTFFDNSTRHSLASGEVLAHFGTLAEMALGSAGSAIDKLSAAYAPHTAEVEQFFHQAGTVIGQFSSTAIPMLMDMGGTTLRVFSAALKVIAPFADEIGAIAGAVLPAYSAMKLLNTVVSPLTGLLSGKGLGGAFKSSAKEGSGLLGTLGGLVTSFPAVAGAAAATGLILGTYYLQQRKISQQADDYAQAIQSGGDAAVKAASDYGQQQKALDDLIRVRDKWNAQPDVQAMGADDAKGSAMNDQIAAQNTLLAEKRKRYQELHDSLGPLGQRQLELNKIVAEEGPTSSAAMAAAAAYQAQKESDTSTELALQGAMQGVNDAYMQRQQNLVNAAGSDLSYRQSVLATEQAQKNLTETLKTHKAGSEEARAATMALEGTQLAQAEAAKQQAMATSTATNEQSRGVAGTAAYNAEILKLAAATNGNWTPAMQTAIGTMSATELATIGVTRSVNEAGQAVYRLPNGKTITIDANTQAAKDRLAEIERYRISDKFFTVTMRQQVDRIGTPIAGSNRTGADGSQMGGGGFNDGGWVGGRGMAGPSQGEDNMLIGATAGEFMVRRDRAVKYAGLLEAINGGADVLSSMAVPQAMPVPQAARTALATTAPQAAASGPTVVRNYEINLHEIKSMPSKQWLLDTFADIENGVRV